MNDIAERNIKLVYRVVNLHFGGNPDLYDVGMIGLVKGAKSYDPTKNKEANYLCKCIKNEILLFLRKEKNRIKPISLSTTVCDEITIEDTVESDIDVEETLLKKIEYEKLYKCIDKLSPIEKDVIYSRYALGNTEFKLQSEIGKKYGLAQSNICVIEKRALKKLRRMMKDV